MEFGLWWDYYSKCLFPCDDIQWRHFVQATSHVQSNYYSSQMQGVDIKYNGHAWSKVIITNIKNSFGLCFKKACCLGHFALCRWLWLFCPFKCSQQDFLEWKISPHFGQKADGDGSSCFLTHMQIQQFPFASTIAKVNICNLVVCSSII